MRIFCPFLSDAGCFQHGTRKKRQGAVLRQQGTCMTWYHNQYTIVCRSVVEVCHCWRSAASQLMLLPLSKEEPLLLPPEDVPVTRSSGRQVEHLWRCEDGADLAELARVLLPDRFARALPTCRRDIWYVCVNPLRSMPATRPCLFLRA